MKLWLSHPSERTGKRHLVLDLTAREEHDVIGVLREQVVRNRAPRRAIRPDGSIRYRFSREHLDRLMATFPFAELSPGLERRQRRAAQREQAELVVPDLDLPDLHADLYDFQKIGVQAVIDGLQANGSFFLNDQMGLGKTVQALAVMVKLQATPALVVCPNSAKWVWERMIQRFTDFEPAVLDATTQTPAQREELLSAHRDITIVNIEALRLHPELRDFKYELIITDEVHRVKNPTTQQAIAWSALRSRRNLMMTGTPILNRVEDIWTALNRAFPKRYPNYDLFVRWLCIKGPPIDVPIRVRGALQRDKNGRVKTRRVPGKVVGYRADAFEQLRDHIHDPSVSLRRRKDQVLSDLPEVVYNTLLVDLTAEQRRLYNRIVGEMKLELQSGKIRDVNGVLAVITRAKQACFSPELYGGSSHSAKVDELKELVSQVVDGGGKALIGSQWRTATRIIQRELAQYNPAYVDSTVKGRHRQEQEDRFNEDESCLVYIGTLMANQEAITLDAASYVVFTDKLWSPLANDQFVARSAAGGLRGVNSEHGTVNVVELFAHDTVEERIELLLGQKRSVFNAFVESDGGPIQSRLTVSDLTSLF